MPAQPSLSVLAPPSLMQHPAVMHIHPHLPTPACPSAHKSKPTSHKLAPADPCSAPNSMSSYAASRCCTLRMKAPPSSTPTTVRAPPYGWPAPVMSVRRRGGVSRKGFVGSRHASAGDAQPAQRCHAAATQPMAAGVAIATTENQGQRTVVDEVERGCQHDAAGHCRGQPCRLAAHGAHKEEWQGAQACSSLGGRMSRSGRGILHILGCPPSMQQHQVCHHSAPSTAIVHIHASQASNTLPAPAAAAMTRVMTTIHSSGMREGRGGCGAMPSAPVNSWWP